MTVYFNEEKYKQLGVMHLKVDLIIFSKNESIFDFSRLRTTINNWKNKRSLNSHKRYLSFKKGLFFPSKLLNAPTIPLSITLKNEHFLDFLEHQCFQFYFVSNKTKQFDFNGAK
jgi:hypothetical protein